MMICPIAHWASTWRESYRNLVPMSNSLMHTHPKVWARIRVVVMVRDHYECQIRLNGCKRKATQIDHIISLMDGGTDDLENLQAACAPCNKRKGAGFLERSTSPD